MAGHLRTSPLQPAQLRVRATEGQFKSHIQTARHEIIYTLDQVAFDTEVGVIFFLEKSELE